MSENSFENSTFSENTSYNDELAGSNLGSPNSCGIADGELMSLPTHLSTPGTFVRPSQMHQRTTKPVSMTMDAELNDLLIRKQPKFVPQAPKCATCDKSVYKAEEIRAANKTFHKLCFKCNSCNKLLEPNILTEHQGDLYCKNCYAKNFGPKGYGYGAGAGILASDSASLSPTAQVVNSPPSVPGSGGTGSLKWTFSSLQSPTESSSPVLNGGNGGNVRVGVNGPALSSTTVNSAVSHAEKRLSTSVFNGLGGADRCARCAKPVYAAEKVNAAGKCYHKLCFNCTACKKLLNSMNCCDNSDGDVFCKACYGKQYGPKGVGYGVGAGTLQTN